jgi:fructose transport system substrate-binding protein
MNAPIEDQLRDYFTMVDRMQGSVDTTPHAPTLSLITNSPDTNDSTMEVMMLSPDRNESPTRSRTWVLVAACIAAVALIGGLIVTAGSDDGVPADEPVVTDAPLPAAPEEASISLIVSDSTDPFTSALVDAVQVEADALSTTLNLVSSSDSQAVADAVAEAIDRGDTGILTLQIDDTIRPSLEAARAAGIVVVGLNTPVDESDAVDASIAYDDYISGQLAGLAAGDAFAGGPATIAMLDLEDPSTEPADILRDQGFLNGFGIVAPCASIGCGRDQVDMTSNGNEPANGPYTGFTGSGDYEIACRAAAAGTIDGGRSAMETCLAANSDINVVYAFNEAAAEGAADAIEAAGRTGEVVISTIGGSCYGVSLVADGRITALALQPPEALAQAGTNAIERIAEGGTVVANSSAGDFVVPTPHTAVNDNSGDGGYNAMSSQRAADVCWN